MGEGSIGLNRHFTSSGNYFYTPFVDVTNTQKVLLEWLLDITGTGKISPKRRDGGRQKACWAWRLRVEEMADFLTGILPYLVIKDEQARLLQEFLSLPVSPGVTVEPKVAITREFIYRELATLNKRGGVICPLS